MQYLLDTNIIIYYFNGLTRDERIDQLLVNSFNLSVISQIEFLGWNGFRSNPELHQTAQEFIENATIFSLNEKITQETIKLRQQYKIKTPDAIIAATALLYDLEIVTNNNSDFQQLGLKILNIHLSN